ncbi:HelD family protein [Streptomyces sp. NBC_00649]|uniref:HelD family protein n=1 Tax=Streptomyces sp. NBC_00649 TaxID=2975798 RepID=UPI0032560DC5
MQKRARRAATLAAEQRAVDQAYHCLDRTRQEAIKLKGMSAAASGKDAIDANQGWQRELDSLDLGRNALVFLRADVAEGAGEQSAKFYIGRRTVRDADRNLVVLSWNAPAAIQWRLTNAAEPGNVTLLRRLVCDQQTVKRYMDLHGSETASAEPQDAPLHDVGAQGGSAAESGEQEWRDPLLDELDRARDGAMHDIVETIQREQLLLVAEKPQGILIVQGGPGTGKTAVGLHRVSWLLDNRHAATDDILVVGPNRGFLGYIGSVLGELGATGITLLELPVLWNGSDAPRDPRPVAAVKSASAMSQVLRRAVDQQITTEAARLETVVGGPDFTFELRNREVSVPVAEISDIAENSLLGDSPYQVRRERFRQRMVQRLTEAYVALLPGPADVDYFAAVDEHKSVQRLLRRIVPELSATNVYRRLTSDRSALAAAAADSITLDEQALLCDAAAGTHGGTPRLSLEDLVCIDELEHILTGRPDRTYGHVVVDEAQDLTPMQARSLARRCPSGSMTVVGDLAQATGPVLYETWEQLGALLARRDGWRSAELRTGFRVPDEVMRFVRSLGAHCAGSVTVPDSVRRTGTEVIVSKAADPVGRGAERAVELAKAGRSVALVLAERGMWHSQAQATVNGHPEVAVLTADEVKGLEFDHVVVVEPAAIVNDEPVGPRRLYVALTRCTQSLTVIHHRPLPQWLGGPDGAAPTPQQLVSRFRDHKQDGPGNCSRYHADGTRCANSTENADGWCRRPGCGGFRSAEPLPVAVHRVAHLSVPRDASRDERLMLTAEQIERVRISSVACAAFTTCHGGDRAAAAVELHVMLGVFLSEGRHHRMENRRYLDLEGYRLVLDGGATAVVGYLSVHSERSYAQFAAGVPSRVGRDARAARRSQLSIAGHEAGTDLPDDGAVRTLRVESLHLTPSACKGYERLQQGRDVPDDVFVRHLREDLAFDLKGGGIERVGNRFIVEGERHQWHVTSDGMALISARKAGSEIYRGPMDWAETAAPSNEGEEEIMSAVADQADAGTPRDAATTESPPLPGLAGLVARHEHEARTDRAHEALRHRLLGELYELSGDVGQDDHIDAWHRNADDLTLFEVSRTSPVSYTDLRQSALHLLESAALRPEGQPENLVVVLREQPVQPWAAEALSRSFGVEVAWRNENGWDGPAAHRITGADDASESDQ